MKTKVIGEVYRVLGQDFDSPKKAAIFAMIKAIEENYTSVKIQRITIHEPVSQNSMFNSFFGPITKTMTGSKVVMGPASYDFEIGLSRYNPVNGWVLPAEIEVGE